MSDHWQTIESALKYASTYHESYWSTAVDNITPSESRKEIDAALAFVRQMREGVRPDWTNAPAWANWWAVDSTGAAFWYANEPQRLGNDGWVGGGKSSLAYHPGDGWRTTLRQRPQPQDAPPPAG